LRRFHETASISVELIFVVRLAKLVPEIGSWINGFSLVNLARLGSLTTLSTFQRSSCLTTGGGLFLNRSEGVDKSFAGPGSD